jgi:hypothetical protein
MADNSGGGMGVLGVLVGVLIVILVGGAILYGTGMIGSPGGGTTNVKIEAPKAPAPTPSK